MTPFILFRMWLVGVGLLTMIFMGLYGSVNVSVTATKNPKKIPTWVALTIFVLGWPITVPALLTFKVNS